MIDFVSNKPHYENVPFEIPESWEWVRLDDVAQSNIGLTYSPSEITNDGIPVLRSCNIKNQKLYWEDLVRVNSNILEKQYLNDGDLLICARNGSRHLVGKCALITNIQEPISFGAFMAVCRSQFNRWIYYLLHTTYFDRYLDDSNSTTINQVTQKMLLDFQIPLPPAVEQQRIVAEVEKWFALIDELEVNKEDLKEYIKQVKSKVLDLAIHGKLVPQDPNEEPAIELLRRINPNFKPCDTSHYENLPAGWSVVQLCDIAKTVTGSTPSKNNKSYYGGTFPLYKPSDLDAGRNVNEASEYLSDEGKRISRIIPANSIAICCIGSIGKCGYIMREGTTNQQINTIIPLYNIYPLYIYYFCLSASFVQQLLEKSSAVTIAIVNKSKLDSTFILLPPLAEQKRIAEQIETIFASLDTITAEL